MKPLFTKWLLLSCAFLVVSEIANNVLNFKALTYNSLAEQLSKQQIQYYFDLQEKWKWLGYVFVPILLLVKTSLIASVFYVGTFFFSKAVFGFKQLWEIVITAEFVFLLVPIIKIFWFSFFETNYNLQDVQYSMPLSALTILGYKGLDVWFIYPLQILNLFELAYWLLLAYYIGKATKTNMDNGLKIVLLSYVPTLFFWVIVVMFITLNMS